MPYDTKTKSTPQDIQTKSMPYDIKKKNQCPYMPGDRDATEELHYEDDVPPPPISQVFV